MASSTVNTQQLQHDDLLFWGLRPWSFQGSSPEAQPRAAPISKGHPGGISRWQGLCPLKHRQKCHEPQPKETRGPRACPGKLCPKVKVGLGEGSTSPVLTSSVSFTRRICSRRSWSSLKVDWAVMEYTSRKPWPFFMYKSRMAVNCSCSTQAGRIRNSSTRVTYVAGFHKTHCLIGQNRNWFHLL